MLGFYVFLYLAIGFCYSWAAKEFLKFWIAGEPFSMVESDSDFVIHWAFWPFMLLMYLVNNFLHLIRTFFIYLFRGRK
jgi:hypothetical protein